MDYLLDAAGERMGMSHISKYKHRVKNLDILKTVSESLGFKFVEGKQTVKMFGSQHISKDVIASVRLSGWRYAVAIDSDGVLSYDHFGSEANSFDRLGELVQAYNVEAITQEFWATGLGSNLFVEKLGDGARKLVLEY